MIYASTNFSHSVEWRKRTEHTLVTDGIYAWVPLFGASDSFLNNKPATSGIRRMLGFTIGHLEPSWCCKIPFPSYCTWFFYGDFSIIERDV
jgi:hypothetical protein